MRQIIMIELETQLIQEWRDQNGIFAPNRPNYENEETRKVDEKSNDRASKQHEQEISKQRMIQLKAMAKQLKKLTLLHSKIEGEHQKGSHPFCTRIKRKTWE